MHTPLRFILPAGLIAISLLTSVVPDRARAGSSVTIIEGAPADDAGIEVQARGPVHEGFAQPVPLNVAVSPVVAKDPPKAIAEVPPDQKPEGKDVQWLPGYWSWDTDKKDYLWVSGTWRVPPTGRTWVPGRWSKTSDGWQWAPGFWSDGSDKQADFLEPPPDSLDVGPSTPAPNDNSFYVPGVWLPIRDRFVWRPGYWNAYRPGWLWNSSRYIWTPGGYMFQNGYWDYPFEDRGLLFAPVYFRYPYWSNSSWFYQPRFAVGFGGLFDSLWVGPGYGSYYFGNYYGPGYAGRGFSPWLTYGPRFNDPAFRYYSWANRGNPGWMRGLQSTYRGRAGGTLPVPANTLAAQNAMLARSARSASAGRNSLQTVAPLGKANAGVKLTGVSSSEMAQHRASINSFKSAGQTRARVEAASRLTTQGASGRAIAPSSFQRGGNGGRSFYSGPSGAGPRIINGATNGPRIINGPTRSTAFSSTTRSAPTYRSSPSFRSAPSYRSAPTRSGSSFRGGSSNRGGGSRGSSGGHRR